MHIHILGICGTFMGSLAVLAKQAGYEVSGSDEGIYPPMSTQLESQGIALMQGYSPENLQPHPDLVVIGNAMSRGNSAVEYLLEQGLPYTSGPEWFARHILKDKWTLAVSGTHGKTTTTAMLAWILEYAGMQPGFLIGGVPGNFEASARLGNTPFFVVEADEYDSAFFDKRSKFIHYRPRTLIINNLEFDHADIFDELADIQRQFHHLIRTVPASGQIIYPQDVPAIADVIKKGCWSEQVTYQIAQESESGWWLTPLSEDGRKFVFSDGDIRAEVNWTLTGTHNLANAMSAMLAARHVGVTPEVTARALCEFKNVKRRMEVLAETPEWAIYDDFAHHPTAIATTLDGLRKRVGEAPIIALIEPRSNTMKAGVHQHTLADSANTADAAIWANLSNLFWLANAVNVPGQFSGTSLEELQDLVINAVRALHKPGVQTHVVIMSNGGFGGIHNKMIARLQDAFTTCEQGV